MPSGAHGVLRRPDRPLRVLLHSAGVLLSVGLIAYYMRCAALTRPEPCGPSHPTPPPLPLPRKKRRGTKKKKNMVTVEETAIVRTHYTNASTLEGLRLARQISRSVHSNLPRHPQFGQRTLASLLPAARTGGA